ERVHAAHTARVCLCFFCSLLRVCENKLFGKVRLWLPLFCTNLPDSTIIKHVNRRKHAEF
uniref:Uncharacterized protein n=1 Tax=Anopheles dirus TaxID=7168 RepID=A0A182NVS8_9DIPT